jgi:hypothetical protein
MARRRVCLVQAQHNALIDAAVAFGDLDTVPLGELCQLHRALSLRQQVQSLDHHPVEEEQVFFPHVAQGLNEQLEVQTRLFGTHHWCKYQSPDCGAYCESIAANTRNWLAVDRMQSRARWVGQTRACSDKMHETSMKKRS